MAPKPAFVMAATNASTLADPVTSALSGIATFTLLTPGTLVSADCTLFTQPTPHVIPDTLSDTVFSSTVASGAEVDAVFVSELLHPTNAKPAIADTAIKVVIFLIMI